MVNLRCNSIMLERLLFLILGGPDLAMTRYTYDFESNLVRTEFPNGTEEVRGYDSLNRLLSIEHIEPYHDYCRHCDVLYRNVLEPLGYSCEADLSACEEARCSFVVKTRNG